MNLQPIVVERVTALTAFVHGLVSFFTPCMFPLIPLLLPMAQGGFKKTFLFSISFVGTFAALGILPPFMKAAVPRCALKWVVGALVVVFGVAYILGFSGKSGKVLKAITERDVSPALLGVGIGLVWMACSTPVLASILSLLALSETFLSGMVLMVVYSLGILVPFLAFGGMLSAIFEKIGERGRAIVRIIGGAVIILSGLYITWR